MSQAAGAGAGAAAAASAVNSNVRSGGKRKAETRAAAADDDGKSRKLTQDDDAKVGMRNPVETQEVLMKRIHDAMFCGDNDLIPDTEEDLLRQLNALSRRPLLEDSLKPIEPALLELHNLPEKSAPDDLYNRTLGSMTRSRHLGSFPFIQKLKFPKTIPVAWDAVMTDTLSELLEYAYHLTPEKPDVDYFLAMELSLLLRLFVVLGGNINAARYENWEMVQWGVLPSFIREGYVVPLALFMAGRRLKIDWEVRTRPHVFGMYELSVAAMLISGISGVYDRFCGLGELARRAAVLVGDAGMCIMTPLHFTRTSVYTSRASRQMVLCNCRSLWVHLYFMLADKEDLEWLNRSVEIPGSKLLIAVDPEEGAGLVAAARRVNRLRASYARRVDGYAEGIMLFATGPWSIIAGYAVTKEARDCAAAAAAIAAAPSAVIAAAPAAVAGLAITPL